MKKLILSSVVLLTFALALLIFEMSSCKKAVAQTTPASSILGLWTGTYKVDGNSGAGEQYFSFIIKPDGTMINDTKGEGQQHLSPGTWSLKGDTLSCTFTCVYGLPSNIGITETSTCIWDKTGKLTMGTWKNVPASGSGTFTLAKVN